MDQVFTLTYSLFSQERECINGSQSPVIITKRASLSHCLRSLSGVRRYVLLFMGMWQK